MPEQDFNADANNKRTDINKRTIKACQTGRDKKPRHKFYVFAGTLIFLIGFIYVSLQLARCSRIPQAICITYIALLIIPVGLGMFLRGIFHDWVHRRRTVKLGELNDLYSEVDSFGQNAKPEILQLALEENKRLDAFENVVFEIDVLPLRKQLVDMYEPEYELIAKAKRELNLLNEYTSIVDAEVGEKWNKRILSITKKLEDELKKKNENTPRGSSGSNSSIIEELEKRLRSDLKSLRETVAWYDQTWAIGEKVKDCVTYWVAVTALVTFLVGILPIIHFEGDWDINILHWASLGSTGALLSILLRLHSLDVPELGETAGYDLLQGTVRSIIIGALTAVILFAAIWGKALGGQIFPELTVNTTVMGDSAEKGEITLGNLNDDISFKPRLEMSSETRNGQIKNHGLAIFWAIFAGLSPVVLKRLSQIAESSLGEPKNDLDDD